MFIKKIFCFLPMFAFIGCANYSDGYEINISPKFSTDQIDTITSAAQSWLNAVNDPRQLKFTAVIRECDVGNTNRDHVICIFPESQEMTDMRCIASEAHGLYPIGCTHRSDFSDTANISISKDIITDNAQLLMVSAHEIGHAMGLSHTGAGTIMCSSVGCTSLAPTCKDVNQYVSLRGMTNACK